MDIDIISYHALLANQNNKKFEQLEKSLFEKGIVGISHVPDFELRRQNYIVAARKFAALSETIKQQYAPNRDAGFTEGYELGAEQFKDSQGQWQIDHQKSSYYAYVPDHMHNKWPTEMDLKSHYLAIGELIFKTGKILLNAIGIDDSVGLCHHELMGYGRMLHYQKHAVSTQETWCGAHFDHGLLTGLMPAYYFQDNKEIVEPADTGLYVLPAECEDYFKVDARDKSILYFQVGEFSQLITHDRIKATKHYVKQSKERLERFTYALFIILVSDMVIKSQSILAKDARYLEHQASDNSITYKKWASASYARYRAK